MATRKSIQRVVTLALDVLHHVTHKQSLEKGVDTIEMRLALAALWLVMNDRRQLIKFLEHAAQPRPKPWEGCRSQYNGICHDLRKERWHAPVGSDICFPGCEVCLAERWWLQP